MYSVYILPQPCTASFYLLSKIPNRIALADPMFLPDSAHWTPYLDYILSTFFSPFQSISEKSHTPYNSSITFNFSDRMASFLPWMSSPSIHLHFTRKVSRPSVSSSDGDHFPQLTLSSTWWNFTSHSTTSLLTPHFLPVRNVHLYGPQLCLPCGYVGQSLFQIYNANLLPHFPTALTLHQGCFLHPCHPVLKFTWTIFDTPLTFLDLSPSQGPEYLQLT